jgi:hypothetical protein
MEGWGHYVIAQDEPEPASGDDTAADEVEPASGTIKAEDDIAADERVIQPKKKKKKKKGKPGLSPKLRDTKFKELEQFHHNWFNLPPNRVKKSLENAIKFCKTACTKEQCSDAAVSNNCHLMCPTSTLKNCPDLTPKTEAPAEAPETPSQNDQAQEQTPQEQPSQDSPGQSAPVVTINGMPQEQVQALQQAPISSDPNTILPADQIPADQDGG